MFMQSKCIVDEDARYTMKEISDISGLVASYVVSILKEKLRLRKVYARRKGSPVVARRSRGVN
jgi:hypothetical protein